MIRVLVDENLSEFLADGLNAIQKPLNNGIELQSMAKIFGKGAADEVWIPSWGKKDGIVLTQDLNITRTRHQVELFQQNELAGFFLKVPGKSSYWARVETLIKHWPEISKIILTKTRPYSYLITPRKVEELK